MLEKYNIHNLFKENIKKYKELDPNLSALKQLKYRHDFCWWHDLSPDTPGIYTLTGGRQVGKSTSCKQLIEHCLQKKIFAAEQIFYLPCDEIFDGKELASLIRFFLENKNQQNFLLIIDEITFVKNWERVIKALADEGHFTRGICILTGSDTLILKEAAMSFPGRRGTAAKVDYHVYPLSFTEYVGLIHRKRKPNNEELANLFNHYLACGGYLRAINDLALTGKVNQATYLTYEQWIRGDFLKKRKSETNLKAILQNLLIIGVSQISYSALTQKIGLMSKETCIDYCNLLESMDILINLQAFDQNKKQGFPRKARKFHFVDPFIQNTITNWLRNDGYANFHNKESQLVEACVASHCHRKFNTYYFKGQHGEVDVINLNGKTVHAIEVKWSDQLRSSDLKTLHHFKKSLILTKHSQTGTIENIETMPVYQFLYELFLD